MSNNLDKMQNIIDKDLKEVISLQKELKNLKNHIAKINYELALKSIASIEKSADFLPLMLEEVNSYKTELIRLQRDFKLKFDSEFIKECEKNNLIPVTGNNLKGYRIKGIIKVFIDFDKGSCRIGTDSRKINIRSVRVIDIIKDLIKLDKILYNRHFYPKDFIKDLFIAYNVCSGDKIDRDVVLRDVQKEFWAKKQKESFWQTFDKSKLEEYTTDDFSIDLYKLIKIKEIRTRDGYRFILSEGTDGILVYDEAGKFKPYKFIKFTQ